jgi:hypothetical protein
MKEKKLDERQIEYIAKFKSKLKDRKAWPLWIPKHYNPPFSTSLKESIKRMERICAQFDQVQERNCIPLSPEQTAENLKILASWNEEIASFWENLTTNRFFAGSTREEQIKLSILAQKAKSKLEVWYRASGRRLCARSDCFKLIPLGSRDTCKYCSEQCRATEKTRRQRNKPEPQKG